MLTSADRVPIWGSAEPRGSDSRQSSGPSLTYLCSNMPPTTSTNPPVIPNRRHSRNPKSDLWCACLPVSGVSRACGAGAADPRPSLSSGMCEPHGGLQGRGPRPAGSARESKQLVSSGGGGWAVASLSHAAWGSRRPGLPENTFGHLCGSRRLEQGSDLNLNLISAMDEPVGPSHLLTSLKLGSFTFEILLNPEVKQG